jgi:hypothetical protein
MNMVQIHKLLPVRVPPGLMIGIVNAGRFLGEETFRVITILLAICAGNWYSHLNGGFCPSCVGIRSVVADLAGPPHVTKHD